MQSPAHLVRTLNPDLYPDHVAFRHVMQDERLADPIVLLGDLQGFRTQGTASRLFVR
ncbi:hypothetical protein [Sphingomonas sp. Leaf357]|uniref:hypothetical protein n=1 Tax=Sphingomonas sp. Leaf357 TaxID=1736350 RepID=UPI000A8CBB12|nr:hypothetical protein [Sphingomonas sp. Leaf357]